MEETGDSRNYTKEHERSAEDNAVIEVRGNSNVQRFRVARWFDG